MDQAQTQRGLRRQRRRRLHFDTQALADREAAEFHRRRHAELRARVARPSSSLIAEALLVIVVGDRAVAGLHRGEVIETAITAGAGGGSGTRARAGDTRESRGLSWMSSSL